MVRRVQRAQIHSIIRGSLNRTSSDEQEKIKKEEVIEKEGKNNKKEEDEIKKEDDNKEREVEEPKKEESPEEKKKREKKEKLEKIKEFKNKKKVERKFDVRLNIKYDNKDKFYNFYANNKKFNVEKEESPNIINDLKFTLKDNCGFINSENTYLTQHVFNHSVLIVNQNNTFFEVNFPININSTFQQFLDRICIAINISSQVVALFIDGKKYEKGMLTPKIGDSYKKEWKIAIVICCEIAAYYHFLRRGINNNVRNKNIYDKMQINNYLISMENLNLYSVYLPKENLLFFKIIEIDINPNDIINKKLKKPDVNDDKIYRQGYYLAEVYDFESLTNNMAEIEKQKLTKVIFEKSNIKYRTEQEKNKNKHYTEGGDFMRIMLKQTNNEIISNVDSSIYSKDCITLLKSKIYVFKFHFLNNGSCNCLIADRHKVSFYFDCNQKEVQEDIDSNRPFIHMGANKNNPLIGVRAFELRKNTPFYHKYTQITKNRNKEENNDEVEKQINADSKEVKNED